MRPATIAMLAIALIAVFATIASAGVTVKFEQDYVAENIPTQLRIQTTNDVNLDGMTFRSAIPDGETGTMVMSLSGASSILYGATSSGGTCINAATGQVIGSLGGSSFSLSFGAASSAWEDKWKDGNYGEFDMLCQVHLSKPADFTKFTSNMIVTWTKTNEIIPEELTIQVGNVPSSFRKVEIKAEEVEYKVQDKSPFLGELKTSFTVNAIGVYDMYLTNSLSFSGSIADYKKSSYFCKSGDHEFRMVWSSTVKVYVFAVPTEPIKCTIPLYDSPENYDSKEKTEFVIISSVDSTIESRTTLDYAEKEIKKVAGFTAYLDNAAKDNWVVYVSMQLPNTTDTKIGPNTEIEIQLTTDLDLETYSSERSFCSGNRLSRQGNIFVAKEFNKSSLDDTYPQTALCHFYFNGTNAFDYDTFKGTSVTAKVDGISLKGIDGYHTGTKITLRAYADMDISHDDTKDDEKNGNYIITDTFDLESNENWYVPAKDVVITFYADPSRAVMSHEDWVKHLECSWDAGTDRNMKLDFDYETLTWSYKTSTVGSGKPSFELSFTCTRTYPKITKYGKIVTYAPRLYVASFVQDEGYAINVHSTFVDRFYPDEPTSRPGDAETPGKAIYRATVSKSTIIEEDTGYKLSTYKQMAKDFASEAKDLLNKGIEGNYTSSDSISYGYGISSDASFSYVDYSAPQRWRKFYKDEIKFKGGYGYQFGYVSTPGGSDRSLSSFARPTVSISQSFELTPTGSFPFWGISQSPITLASFENNWSVQSSDEPASSGSFVSAHGSWVTPTSGCGVTKGSYFNVPSSIADPRDYDWSEWSTVLSTPLRQFSCTIDDKCEYNADCSAPSGASDYATSLCKGGKCVLKPLGAPKYRRFEDNASAMVSFVFAMIVVVLALLF